MPVRNHPLSPEELMAYLDGELAAVLMAQAAEHLKHRRDCQSLAADLQGVSRGLAVWEIDVSENSSQCPASASPASGRSTGLTDLRRLWSHYRLQAFAGFAVLLLVGGLGLLYRPERARTPAIRGDGQAPIVGMFFSSRDEGFSNRQKAQQSVVGVVGVNGRSRHLPADSFNALDLRAGEVTPSRQEMIARAAQLRMTVTDFSRVREAVMGVLKEEKGYVSTLDINEPPEGGRRLTAALKIPVQRLDATLLELKRLGRVEAESQTGEDVTRQVVDVEARLSNLRSEEDRLNQILRERTGKLSDVLTVEEQISNVRGQTEASQAEQKNLSARVTYASLSISIVEEYTRTLMHPEAPSTATTLHNAAIEGLARLQGFCIDLLVVLLSGGPLLVLLAGVGFGAYTLIRWLRFRRRNTG